MIGILPTLYADFCFFTPPEDRRFVCYRNDSEEKLYPLKLPDCEINFVKKAISDRAVRLLLICDSNKRPIFIPLSLCYSTGVGVAFYPDFDIPLRAFEMIGDLKCDIAASPRFLRELNKGRENAKFSQIGMINFFDNILNVNRFFARCVEFNFCTHDIASLVFSFTAAISMICGCEIDIDRKYPDVAFISSFDFGMFGLFTLCALKAITENTLSQKTQLSVFVEDGRELFFELCFFGELRDEFEPLAHAAAQRRMLLRLEKNGRETKVAFSPVRPELSKLGLKEDYKMFR